MYSDGRLESIAHRACGGASNLLALFRMRQMTIRKIDDQIYERLKKRARAAGRSLEAEARAILGQAAMLDKQEFARRATAIRNSLAGRYKGDATAMIREDRDR